MKSQFNIPCSGNWYTNINNEFYSVPLWITKSCSSFQRILVIIFTWWFFCFHGKSLHTNLCAAYMGDYTWNHIPVLDLLKFIFAIITLYPQCTDDDHNRINVPNLLKINQSLATIHTQQRNYVRVLQSSVAQYMINLIIIIAFANSCDEDEKTSSRGSCSINMMYYIYDTYEMWLTRFSSMGNRFRFRCFNDNIASWLVFTLSGHFINKTTND